MKQQIKDFVRLIKNITLPQKSNSCLSVFQKTIAVCLWIVLLSVIGAVAIVATQFKSHWLSFLENILVGVSCSAFVVIVSAYLQFVSEHSKMYHKHNAALNSFLFNVSIEIELPSQTPESRSWSIAKITSALRDYQDIFLDLIWYDPYKERKYRELLGKVFPIIHAVDLFRHTERSLIRLDVSPEAFNETVDAAIALADTKEAPSNDLFKMLRINIDEQDKTE